MYLGQGCQRDVERDFWGGKRVKNQGVSEEGDA